MSTTAAARVMARGRHIELRLWERDPANYVQAGALIVLIGDDPPLEVHAGDSFVVPPGLGCTFEVLEPAILVEAISPSHRSN